MLRPLPRRRHWVIDRMDGRRACRQNRPGAEGHQQGFSKVMEVNTDSLRNEPWKQGTSDSTFTNERRGRDSNFQENRGENKGLTEGWHRIRHSFHRNRFRR